MTESPKCGCGRSPTGNCIGWHALSEEEYQEKKLPMTHVRFKNLKNEYWLGDCAMATAQPMLRIGFPEIAKC